jgi:ABC-type sugar transport system substrate-binding protein
VFVINAGLLEKDKKQYGGPREHFKYWIGQMVPDEERAGHDLAKTLLEHAEGGRKLPSGSLRIMALGGREEDFPAVLRLVGLGKAVADDQAAALERVVPANWSQDDAKAKTPLILERFPNTKIFWAANDAMAMGVVAALEELGRHPGEEIFVGGIDWDDDAVKAVADGKLTATVGGHFLDGAWALVLLYDYHHGIDFASERTDWQSKMLPLTKKTAKEYLNTFGVGNWRKVDFRSFSKACNSGLKRYDFSLDKLLLDLKAAKKGEP